MYDLILILPTHDKKLQRNKAQLHAKWLKPQIINPNSHTQPNTFPLPLKLPFKIDLHGFMHE